VIVGSLLTTAIAAVRHLEASRELNGIKPVPLTNVLARTLWGRTPAAVALALTTSNASRAAVEPEAAGVCNLL
jgi:hypothetical protein